MPRGTGSLRDPVVGWWRRGLAATGMILALAACQHDSGKLAAGFRAPPHAARPQVWWHWMSGNVSAEGARLDLEWMQRMGIGGVHAFAGGGKLEPTFIDKPLPFMSQGWRDAYRQSVTQARAQGMDITIAGSPGWSQTGGPWVQPRQAMKKYVWSELEVVGGRPVGMLPRPPAAVGSFQAQRRAQGFGPILNVPETYADAAVFGFPSRDAAGAGPAIYRTNFGPVPALGKLPADLSGTVKLPVPEDGSQPFVDIDLGKRQPLGALTIAATPQPRFDVLVSDDGRDFQPLLTLAKEPAEFPSPQQTYALPQTRARFVRVRFERPEPSALLPGRPAPATPPSPIREIGLHRLEITGAARVDRFEAKAGFQTTVDADGIDATGIDTVAIDPGSVVELTDRLMPDGRLDWVPPAGNWTIVRLGWSLTGQANNPAEPSASGLEADKLDSQAVRDYTIKLLAMYEQQAGVPLGPKGIGSLLTDSWEAGAQNWTPAMLQEFARRRGYSAAPWLPVLTGRVVRSRAASDAFLFDFRQTLKDLVADNHYGVLAQILHERGMAYYTEAQGDAPRAISDGLTVKARADIPTAEFWYRPFSTDAGQPPLIVDLEEAASAAHLYGKPLVAAEALTVAAGEDPWSFSPAMLKPVADEIFARGVNRILIHDSHHQPFVDRKPGLELGFFGQYFNRNDTWAEYARPWTDYLAATSFMLQQGYPVADVLTFYGEEQNLTQRYQHTFDTTVPPGYARDYVDAESLLNRLQVRDGRIVAGSMSYRVIYLPPYVDRMSLRVIERLEDLINAGAVVIGRKPVGGLGLGSSDEAVLAVANRLWGSGAEPVRHNGKGAVHATDDMALALRGEGIAPDLAFPATAKVLWAHRRTADGDIYFISNRSDRPLEAVMRMRATGSPELWTADDGRTRPLPFTARADGFTDVPVSLDAQGAGFVVFRPSRAQGRAPVRANPAMQRDIAGPWQVQFEPGRGAPPVAMFSQLADWSVSSDPRIRYFSGVATYTKAIEVPREIARSGQRLLLDLGTVHELAAVSIDGEPIATAWKPPYRIDVTGKMRPGRHVLRIEVANLWVNRLIGDRQPGATAIAYAPQSPYKADSKLLPSGLIGPVRLVTESAGTRSTGAR